MKPLRIALLLLLLTACNNDHGRPTPVPSSEWTISYSEGTPPALTPQPGGGYSVLIPPAPGSIHYVTKATGPLPASGTVRLTFLLTGTGIAMPKPGTDTPPATVRLYFQRTGDDLSARGQYEFFRWWSKPINIAGDGSYNIAAALAPSDWTSVYGRPGTDPAAGTLFQDALNNAGQVGFTLGGQSFAGHGVMATNADLTLFLQDYTVQP
jgi:hypothetical protein